MASSLYFTFILSLLYLRSLSIAIMERANALAQNLQRPARQYFTVLSST